GLGQASALISTLFWLIQYFVFNAFLALFSLKEIRSILIIPQKNSENQFLLPRALHKIKFASSRLKS
ncbi:MAG: hypothetical protein AAF849_06070, partial [Bacteroidota bacterium]